LARALPTTLLALLACIRLAAAQSGWDARPLPEPAEALLLAADAAPSPADAVRLYGQALRLAPSSGAAHDGLGQALLRLNRPDDALTIYRRLLGLFPDEPAVQVRLAISLSRIPQLSRADVREGIGLARRAIDAQPDLHEAWYALSVLQHLDGNYLAAAQSIRNALERADPSQLDPAILEAYQRQETACNDALLVFSPLD
jgi:tetratricopeptide (TPR) repeat protein